MPHAAVDQHLLLLVGAFRIRTACSSRSICAACSSSTPRSASSIWIGPDGSFGRRAPAPPTIANEQSQHGQAHGDERQEGQGALGQGHRTSVLARMAGSETVPQRVPERDRSIR